MKPVVASLRSWEVRLIIYLDDILIIASSIETLNHHKTLAIAGISRVPNQLQEVKSNSIPADCFLGDAGRFGFHAVHSASSKICTHSERMSPLTEHAQSNCSTVVLGIRTSRILSPGRMVCPTLLSSNTNPSDQSSSEVVKLQYTGRFDTSCQIRPSMVDISLTNTTGESYCSTNSRFDHLFGCFPARVGSVLGLQPNRRLLEQDRISGPYQHIRTPSSLLCTQVLSCKSDQQGHLPQNGQYHGSFVLEQHGRHSLPPAPSPCIRDLGLLQKEKSISSGTTHPQQEERRSGYRVASKARSE